jgi:hypothetical protein
VGIRGTGGLIQVLNDGATLVQGTSGIWFLANPAGSINIPAGVAAIAPIDPKQPPRETVQIPTAGPSPLPALIEFVQGEQRAEDGKNVITGDVLQSGSGFVAALAYGADTCGDSCINPFLRNTGGVATFNGSGQMTQLDASARASSIYTLQSVGLHADFGTDGILAWGRWIGLASIPETLVGTEIYLANQGFHYVVGQPTPSMPQSGPATYTLIGATSPTEIDGILLPGTFSGTMSVTDWSIGEIKMNLNVSMPAAGLGYLIDGTALISGSTFSGSFVKGQGVAGTNLNSCASSCSAGIQGFFAGATAERAGVAYHINDNGALDIVGTAAFTKQ